MSHCSSSHSSRRVTRESVRAARLAGCDFDPYEKSSYASFSSYPSYSRFPSYSSYSSYASYASDAPLRHYGSLERLDEKSEYRDGKDETRVHVEAVRMPPFGPRVRLARGNANVRFNSRIHGFKRDAGAALWAMGGGLLCGLFGCCFSAATMD